MYYRCPYCGGRVNSPDKPCQNCGALSSSFVEVHDDKDKVPSNESISVPEGLSGECSEEPKSGGGILLFIVFLAWIAPMGVILNIVILIHSKSERYKGDKLASVARAFAWTQVILYITIIIVLIVLMGQYYLMN